MLYEESLNEQVIERSISAIENAQMLIIGGTSLNVYPAAGFVNYFRGKYLVLINKTETPFDSMAQLVIHKPIGEVLSECVLKKEK